MRRRATRPKRKRFRVRSGGDLRLCFHGDRTDRGTLGANILAALGSEYRRREHRFMAEPGATPERFGGTDLPGSGHRRRSGTFHLRDRLSVGTGFVAYGLRRRKALGV